MVSPKDLKPKTYEGTSLRAHEMKGGKKKGPACRDQKIKGSPVERTGLGYPEATRVSGSSGHAA